MGLSAIGCRARVGRLLAAVDANLLVIANPHHIFYLCGMYIPPTSLNRWGQNFLLLDAYNNHVKLLVHNGLAGAAKAAFVDEVHVWQWYDAASKPAQPMYSTALDELYVHLPVGGGRIGAERGWVPWQNDNWVDITPALATMRRHKDQDELTLIRQAVAATSAGHAVARNIMQPGITELDLYNAVHNAIVQHHNSPVHIMGDFASGERAAGDANGAQHRVLYSDDLVLLDLYPVVNGYRADLAATLAVDRKLTPLQERLETALHAALEAGEALLKAGQPVAAIHQAIQAALASHDEAFGRGFQVHGGHGLGLGHPEAPYIVPESQEVLQPNDVITLEPCVADPQAGYGARIEHNYLITETGFERLSDHKTTFA